MTDPPQHGSGPSALGGPDLTRRDIRLPPLPGRPPPALPSDRARGSSDDSSPSSEGPPAPASPASPPDTSVADVAARAGRPRETPLTDQPTDQLDPPRGRPGERTIAFASPEMAGGRPAPTVGQSPRRPHRWPWVLLTLLPLLVIAGAGIALVILLRGG